ncbi:MAG TPA: DmsC/YnfH family molybdoenzyme membrane anchor subunit [Rhodanobacteraceae bacterium]|nr:DmsC/YnfH family molybdoenzyme membrane anchor subunit [Rhodanobacteraceae bacterium]
MKPALSVIFFTVLAGAGFGLWALLGGALAIGVYPPGRGNVLGPLAIGFVFASVGLLASTLHLGRPGRAWRAFSQWDSSWLSREGLASMATYLPMLAVAGLARGDHRFIPTRIAGAVLCACALVTLFCTARIYTSLKPIAAWRDRRVLPVYLLAGLLSGGLWLWAYLAFNPGLVALPFALALLALALVVAGLKVTYWKSLGAAPIATAGHATGLDRFGAVRAFEGPTTEGNYLTREMAFVLARKHARTLQRYALTLLALLPIIAIALVLAWPFTHAWLAPLAAVSCVCGLFVERWLFFAQARHTVAAYFPAGQR